MIKKPYYSLYIQNMVNELKFLNGNPTSSRSFGRYRYSHVRFRGLGFRGLGLRGKLGDLV